MFTLPSIPKEICGKQVKTCMDNAKGEKSSLDHPQKIIIKAVMMTMIQMMEI